MVPGHVRDCGVKEESWQGVFRQRTCDTPEQCLGLRAGDRKDLGVLVGVRFQIPLARGTRLSKENVFDGTAVVQH